MVDDVYTCGQIFHTKLFYALQYLEIIKKYAMLINQMGNRNEDSTLLTYLSK